MKFWIWPLLAVLTLILKGITQNHPEWTERWYSRGFFQGVRVALDYTVGWLPFPFTYLLFALVLWLAGQWFYTLFFTSNPSFLHRFFAAAKHLGVFLCALVTIFYWIWGFNYNRIDIADHLQLPKVTYDSSEVAAAFFEQTRLVLELRKQLQPDTSLPIPESAALPSREMEKQVRFETQKRLRDLGYPTPGRVRGREPFWPGFLIRFGAVGIYNPFSGESNIDRGCHFLVKPNHLSHEYSHALGFGDEGTCNFLGYLALEKSQQPYLRYSSELYWWRRLSAAWQADSVTVAGFRNQLPTGFREDLRQIRQKYDQYPEFFEQFRYKVYDHYLKAQGIQDGMNNYERVTELMMAWRRK